MRSAVIVVAFLALATMRPVLAERVMSEAAREEEATDIVVGRVSDVYVKDVETELYGKGTIEHRYLVELQVEKVEKGALREKDVVYVRAWKLARFPAHVKAAAGPGGHEVIPEIGDRMRVFAVRGPYPLANQTDNGYAAVYPTGFVKLEAGK
jgi:hypothetical protein